MFKILKKLNKKELLLIFIAFLLILFQVFLDLKVPEIMAEITALVRTEGTLINDILRLGFYMFICALGSLFSAIIVGYLSAYVSSSFSFRIREKLFNKVLSFSMEDIKMFLSSSLITRTTNDTTQIQVFISTGMQMLIKSPILAIWAILKISNKSLQWTLITAGATFIIVVYIIILITFVLPKFKKIQTEIDNLNRASRDNLTGIRVIRAFNAEEYQTKRFDEVNESLTKTQTFTQKMMSSLWPVMNFVMYTLTILIYLVGAYLIDGSDLKLELFSDMIVFSTYAMMILMSFVTLAFIFVLYPRANVSAKRINEVLDEDLKILSGSIIPSKIEKLEFKKVSFKYPDADDYLLKDISFVINKGETLGIIGSTGSGKSTLINLLVRFYDVTSGEILIDDINIKEYKLDELYEKIGYVPQKAGMFSGSIKENLNYGRNKKVSKKELDQATNIAQASQFINKLDDKYNYHVGRSGTNISGGEKQRLSIARVILRKPEIYIFDDTFSALDYNTDYRLRKELNKYTKDKINIIVSQRIGSIMHSNKIMVLSDGKMINFDNHENLLKKSKIYKEIAKSQLSEEDL